MEVLEDYNHQKTWLTEGVTVTETHLVSFAGLSGDFFRLHVDAEYARGSEFGARVVPGPLIYALSVGLVSRSPQFGKDVIAFLGVDRMRHLIPCLIGTTLQVRVTLQNVKPTQDNRTIRSLRYETLNESEQVVMTADMNFLVIEDSKELIWK